jgi:uncharacterized protein (DUF427 family)
MKKRIEPAPGQESVWDYPRPPRVDPTDKPIRVEFNGEVIAETRRAIRVLETSHPPGIYIPREDVNMDVLFANRHRTFCEFKGQASYWDLKVGEREVRNVGWSYENPAKGYEAIQGYLCFYPGRVDACYVDGEKVQPQEGDFYGGWITSDIVGPFKGGAGTWGW